MQKITKLGIMSMAKLMGLMHAFFGAIGGFFVGIAMALPVLFAENGSAGGMVVGLLFFILIPVFYGIAGFLAGALTAWVFNFIVRWTGGLEMELEEMGSGGVENEKVSTDKQND